MHLIRNGPVFVIYSPSTFSFLTIEQQICEINSLDLLNFVNNLFNSFDKSIFLVQMTTIHQNLKNKIDKGFTKSDKMLR